MPGFRMPGVDHINGALRRVPAGALYLAGLLPLAWLVYNLFTGGLGVDPVKVLEHRVGETGLQFLLAGLVVTPLRRFAGLNLIKFRRALGLLAFFYVVLHLLVWVVLDIQFYWEQIRADLLKRPYITVGMAALLMMVPLAVTSNNRMIRRLGPMAWKRLHRLTYATAIAAGLHYVWLVKGWQIEPLVYMALILLLLCLRVPLGLRRVAA
jgi:sulfoxide reductase heme-binding subunit YedZ